MSGETADDESSWTPDLLFIYFTRMIAEERDYHAAKRAAILESIARIDKAGELLNETVTQVPTDVQKAVSELRTLMDERASGIEQRFISNALLSQTESTLNQTALAAALAAQEKAAAVQVETFSSLIKGLGERIDRTIDKNAELAAVASNALGARVTALTEQASRLDTRLAEIMAGKAAAVEQKSETRAGSAAVYTLIGLGIGIVGIFIAVMMR